MFMFAGGHTEKVGHRIMGQGESLPEITLALYPVLAGKEAVSALERSSRNSSALRI